MFKRYVLGYMHDNVFRPFKRSKDITELVNFAVEFNKLNRSDLRLVVFDRKVKIYVYN
jgi:hypothetical protein